jgi:hypothetical protein
MDGITNVNSAVAAPPPAAGAAVAEGGATVAEGGFASVLADAARSAAASSAAAAAYGTASGVSGYADIYGAGMEQMMLSAAASGELTQSQIALFMMYTMTKDDGGELSRYMPVMIEALAGADGLSGASVQSSGTALGAGAAAGGGTGAALPVREWIPASPALVGGESDRSPEKLRAIIDQFNVETAERYRPHRNGDDTYCNIFVWDVTRALGSEIPHYVDAVGAPAEYPNVSGAREQGAVAMERWLETAGARYGWREADAETAQRYANAGRPAVTTAGEIGHTQIVCPSRSGDYDPARGVTVAQAGSRVLNYAYITDVFSQNGLKSVRYFVHD